MGTHLLSSPAKALDAGLSFKLKMKSMFTLISVFKLWNVPYKNAAASYEEMSLLDLFYWIYKCENPILRSERSKNTSPSLFTDSRIVGLPPGFEKHSSITIGAAGDLLYADSLDHSKDILFEDVADLLFDQTISYANFESPLTEQSPSQDVDLEEQAPITYCNRAQFDILKGHKDKNFTVLHTANNHMFDMGVEGIEYTLSAFSGEGILDVGTNKSPNECGRAKILTRDGLKIGFASSTFGLNGRKMPESQAYRINHSRLLSKLVPTELDLLKKQIDHCKSEGCDFIIASVHWGYEFEFFPRNRQIEAAHALVEWGADAIISHHAHVIQPVEYYRTRRDPNRVAVIAYSLGSLAWTFSAPHLVLSMILNLTLTKGRLQGENYTYIEKAKATPVVRNYQENGGRTVTKIQKLSDLLNQQPDTFPKDYIAQIKSYADLVLGPHDAQAEELPIPSATGLKAAA